MAPTRAERSRATRERLYQAALAEFRERGVEAAQVAAIARAAGVAYGSFYTHFENKDAVLLECARRLAGRVWERLATALDPPPDSAAALFRAIASVHAEAELEAPELRDEVWSATVRQAASSAEHPHVQGVAAPIAALQEQGRIRSDRPADELASVFLTGLLGFLARGDRAPPEEPALYCELFARACAP